MSGGISLIIDADGQPWPASEYRRSIERAYRDVPDIEIISYAASRLGCILIKPYPHGGLWATLDSRAVTPRALGAMVSLIAERQPTRIVVADEANGGIRILAPSEAESWAAMLRPS